MNESDDTTILAPDINYKLMQEASDTLLFLSDSFEENKHSMEKMEFLRHIENASQDVVYNITQLLRNLTEEIDDEPEDLLG